MKKTLLTAFLLSSIYSYSQTEVIFEYDESGNQIYRGAKNVSTSSGSTPALSNQPVSGLSVEEASFWRNLSVGPNPTSEELLVVFNKESKEGISKVELHSHASAGRLVYSREISSLSDLELRINMRSYVFGIYVISFYLTNGKVYSKHIIKQ